MHLFSKIASSFLLTSAIVAPAAMMMNSSVPTFAKSASSSKPSNYVLYAQLYKLNKGQSQSYPSIFWKGKMVDTYSVTYTCIGNGQTKNGRKYKTFSVKSKYEQRTLRIYADEVYA